MLHAQAQRLALPQGRAVAYTGHHAHVFRHGFHQRRHLFRRGPHRYVLGFRPSGPYTARVGRYEHVSRVVDGFGSRVFQNRFQVLVDVIASVFQIGVETYRFEFIPPFLHVGRFDGCQGYVSEVVEQVQFE